MTVPHHSEPAREAVAELLSHLKLYVIEKLEPADADMLHDRMYDATAALSASPAPAAGGLEAVRELIASLATIVRAQNGNRHDDINSLLARADAVLASPAATSAETQGGDGVREAAEDFCIAVERDIPSWQSFSVRTHLNRLREALSSPFTSAATRGEPVFQGHECRMPPYRYQEPDNRSCSATYPGSLPVTPHKPAPAVESAQVKEAEPAFAVGVEKVIDDFIAEQDALMRRTWMKNVGEMASIKATAGQQIKERIRASLDLATDAEG